MTRRSFLRNMAGALAVLVLPVAVKASCWQRIKGTLDGNPPFQSGPIYRGLLYRARFALDENPPRLNWTGGRYDQASPKNSIGAPNLECVDAEPAFAVLRLTALPRIFA